MTREYSLAVDGSTYAGSVAVIRNGEVIAERSLPDSGVPGRGERGEDFMPMVATCLFDAGISVGQIERVICGAGPGSFTSLRIAASIAKGIAAGTGSPLYAVSSLQLVVAGSKAAPGDYLAALPAMRGETFLLRVRVTPDEQITVDGDASLVPEASVERIAAESGLTVIGPGYAIDARPAARGAARIMDQIIASAECDLNTWEPTYGRLAEAQVKWEAAHGRPLLANP